MYYTDFDSGWTLNNHLNTELLHRDSLPLNGKGQEKLSKIFISKIESLQVTLLHQNLKASKNYSEAVSFSIVDDQYSISIHTPLQPNTSNHDQTGPSSDH